MDYDRLASLAAAGDETALFQTLIEQLRAQGLHHDLFDALLMRARRRLGVPLLSNATLDELPEPLRSEVEQGYLEACREVGGLLLSAGKLREAWMYLRPTGDKAQLAAALAGMVVDEDNLEDVIELALHEGVATALGFQLVLDRYGTCNAITTFDSEILSRAKPDQAAAAAMLVGRLHRDLLANVRAEIATNEGREPPQVSLAKLVADRDWLFAGTSYHIDITHLASVVRHAHLADDIGALVLAIDLTEYGRRLSPQLQPGGEEPFSEVYRDHGLFLTALQGERVAEAVAYFRGKAEALPADKHGTQAAETYVELLARGGQTEAALQAHLALLPRGAPTSVSVPSAPELALACGRLDLLADSYRANGEATRYAAALLAAREA